MAPGPESPAPPRVAVTGVGIVSPLGADAATHWRCVLAGARAPRWLSETELGEAKSAGHTRQTGPRWFGAPAAGVPAPCRPDVVPAMALAAAREALGQAGLEGASRGERRDWGCVIGVSKPLGPQRPGAWNGAGLSPDGAELWLHAASSAVAREHHLEGPLLAPVAACATGLVSLIRGAELVRSKNCPVVLAGSSDWSLSLAHLGCYRRLGVLARPGDDPAGCGRPFDRNRTGFAVGCGAAVLVLEDFAHARARGASVLAEWCAGGLASDPSSLIDVDPSGAAAARVLRDVLRRSGVPPREVNTVSVHGTGTRSNDLAEARALQQVLGSTLPTSAPFGLKGGLGHLMGAAGSVETATLVLALRDQIVPPTVNFETADPDCLLPLSPRAQRRPLEYALKLSLGFGGCCAAALLRRVSPHD